jgi:hypothetical protein
MRTHDRALLLAVLSLLCIPWLANAAPMSLAPTHSAWCPMPGAGLASASTSDFDVPAFLRLGSSGGFDGAPAPRPLTGCMVDLTCPVTMCVISCSGNTSCSVGTNSVTCDGNTTPCPYPGCSPPARCADPCGFCFCLSQGHSRPYCAHGLCLQ